MPENKLNELLKTGKRVTFTVGQSIARPDVFTDYVYYIESGSVRLLSLSMEAKGAITTTRLGPGNWIGLSNFLLGNHVNG